MKSTGPAQARLQSLPGSDLLQSGGQTHTHGRMNNAFEEALTRQSSKDTDQLNIVLGIDPGTEKTAFLLLEKKNGIVFGDHVSNEEMRRIIDGVLAPQFIAIEMVASYGMPVGKEVFETVRWIGRFEEVAIRNRKSVTMVYRKDVKMHLCNSLKAKDANIRQALIDKYGHPGTKKNPGGTYGISGDVWSALAVADFALNMRMQNVPA